MAIKTGETVNMAAFLGIGIQVEKKDGTAINFKPMAFKQSPIVRQYDTWIGTNDEGQRITILRMDIETVKYH